MAVIRDGDWRLFDYDYQTGRSVWCFHHGDGRTTFRTDYPVTSLIEQNKALLNESAGKKRGDWHRVASVPLNIYHEQLSEAQGQGDGKFMSKWLNDGDNRAFRVAEGNC